MGEGLAYKACGCIAADGVCIFGNHKKKRWIDHACIREPAEVLTYLIESKAPSVARHNIILYVTKEERAKHWHLNSDKPLMIRYITISEVLVCAKQACLRIDE